MVGGGAPGIGVPGRNWLHSVCLRRRGGWVAERGLVPQRHVPRVLWEAVQPVGPAGNPTGSDVARAVAFAIPAEDARQVLAALDQILDHPSYRQYTRTQPPRAGVWRGERGVDLIRLYGPVVAVGSHKPWAVHHSVELEYRNTARWPICASP